MKMKFSYLMLLIALLVAGCAGYFSVWGLSQLFAGASVSVIIMASILEIGKVVTTTALHRYWDKIKTSLKVYLTISVGVLMLITSAGIYGFLSNAFQKTANKLEIHEGEIGVLKTKIDVFNTTIKDNKSLISDKVKEKNDLSDRLNKRINNIDFTKSYQSRSADKATNETNKRISDIDIQIDELNKKNSVLTDSVNYYKIKELNLESTSEISGEVGPLKYISELTGQPMAKVVNFIILLLIFVFDPLAIALILITNRVFELENEDLNDNKIVENISDEGAIEGVTEGAIEGITEGVTEPISEPIMGDTPNDAVNDGVNDDVNEIVSEPKIIKKEPVIPTGKINLEDIKEIKDRGYSVNVPHPKNSNTIERLGSNKIIKNGDNNRLFFKKN